MGCGRRGEVLRRAVHEAEGVVVVVLVHLMTLSSKLF